MEERVILDIMYDLGIPHGPYPESCRSISLYLALEKLGDGVGGGEVGWGWLVFARFKDWQSQLITKVFRSLP